MAGLGLICGALFQSASANAQTIRWLVEKTYPDPIQLEFYSQKRNHVWPGNGRVLVINDDRRYKFDVACEPGEKICLGAWDKATGKKFWGVGLKNRRVCEDCCFYCEDNVTPRQVLR